MKWFSALGCQISHKRNRKKLDVSEGESGEKE